MRIGAIMNPRAWLATSLSRKLTMSFLVVALIPVLLVGWVAYQRSKTELTERLGAALVIQARATIQQIDANLFERHGDVQAFAYPRFIRGLKEDMIEAANFYVERYGVYDLMLLVDPEGNVVATNTIDHEGKPLDTQKLVGRSVRNEKWFEAIKSGEIGAGETYYEDLAEDPWVAEVYGNRGLTLNFSAPILDEEGKLIGAWSNRADFGRIVSAITAQVRGDLASRGYKTGETQVLRKDGMLLDDADAKAVLSFNLAEVGLAAAKAGREGAEGFTQEIHKRRHVEQVNAYAGSKGVPGFDGLGWSVLVRVDTSEALAPAIALRNLIAGIILVMIGVIVVVGLLFARGLTRPVIATMQVLERVARGDLTQRVDVRSQDEIGRMGEALNRAVDTMRQTVQGISDNSMALAGSSEEMSRVSEEMTKHASETSEQASVASAAAEQVSRSLQTVAAGSEEMSASIREIAGNAAEAARVAGDAVRAAEKTSAIMSKLDSSSAEIGEVIKVITSIAEQTNLLALNATIEAARAGEAGKGFAVVANEVKELAKETAQATDGIHRKVESIQSDARSSVEAIGEITGVIGRVSDIASMIASAVEEQSATTSEMGRNVTEAAQGSAQIAESITSVAMAAGHTTQGSSDVHIAAAELAHMAAELRNLVSHFRSDEAEKIGRGVSPERAGRETGIPVGRAAVEAMA
jgi:methyl-accepting chemotaxis protein